jgi:ABC-type transport system involved in cytochrome c biogenesis permease subunit
MKTFVLFLALFATSLRAQLPDPALLRDPEVVAAFKSLPILEGGRFKPLDTHARFLLLRMHGKQSMKIEDPEQPGAPHPDLPGVKKLNATEWLLLSWFRPDIARKLPLFVVDNSQAVGEIDVEPKGLRDRYSWDEIHPGREKLREKAEAYSQIERNDRTGVQGQVISLARNFFDYDLLTRTLDSSRVDWRKETWAYLPEDVRSQLPADGPFEVWQFVPPLKKFIQEKGAAGLPPGAGEALFSLIIENVVRPGQNMPNFPPADATKTAWIAAGTLIYDFLTTPVEEGTPFSIPEPQVVEMAKGREALLKAAVAGEAPFKAAVKEWSGQLRAAAEARGELSHVDREVRYYQRDYFTNSIVLFLLGFLIATLGLMAPRTSFARITGRIALIPLVIALVLTTWGITERCIINERPPVATLYETILFITAVSCLVALLLERVLRNGAALALTGFIGALGLFLSNRFMALDGQDTMPTLEAVLITNFWLATHVTSINIGYAGAMLASILSMVVLAYRTLARGPEAVEKRRLLTRITYGVVCFGLLFSLVGTVLGGIWANDSWGRFWGWDPKENGALMIVLIGLVILHARLGGYIKETGLHVLSVLMGMITLFSWFGVNQLGVGLHSYGFTDGIWRALLISWGIQGVFMLLGIGQWAVEKWSGRSKAKRLASPAEAA